MITAVLLLVVGLALSAFFSGSETGFYRATRVRLVLDALDGDRTARWLLWLTNNPAFFVATTLIGNNLANYMTSLGVVLLTKELAGDTSAAELAATVLFSPLVFVYGELLPKSLYHDAPNLLLRRGGPLFLLFAALFAPLSIGLWGLGWVLQALLGATPLRVRRAIARKELQEVLQEGHDAGILRPAQRHLAQNLFAMGPQRVAAYSRPVPRVGIPRLGASRERTLRWAARHGAAVLPVLDRRGRALAGYVRVIDLCLNDKETLDDVRPLVQLAPTASPIEAIMRLQSEKEEMAQLVDSRGRTVGLVYAADLIDSLFRNPNRSAV